MIKKRVKKIKKILSDNLRSSKKTFTEIYLANSWGNIESKSGPGSTIESTELIRTNLESVLQKFDIKILLDAPCGDFNWMKYVDLSKLKYYGVDVVEEVISKNISNYSKENRSFILSDICKDKLPKADLIFCRDCLVHLSNNKIKATIKNFINSGSEYLLTTNFTDISVNQDIVTGDWREINLMNDPFNFPEPILKINDNVKTEVENNKNYNKHMFLWKLNDLLY